MMSANPKVLLIDDDSDAVLSLSRALQAVEIEVSFLGASLESKALELFQEHAPQVVVLDLCLDERRGVESGFSLLQRMTEHDETCRVIVLTGHGSLEHGIQALDCGAAHFLEKPADAQHLSALIRDCIRQCELRRAYREVQRGDPGGELNSLLLGESEVIEKLRQQIRFVSQTHQPVLITGETGTGKGLCAQVIHKIGKRSQKAFIRYQPNFGNSDLVGSELFGHVKGAFTGADTDRRGLLVDADGGVLFLDEIDELPAETQVALLGVLQDGCFRPLGSNQEIKVDVRFLCATNRSIDKALHEGSLREDLYHRIAHQRIELPPLRDRKEDIRALAEDALKQMRDREMTRVQRIADSAIEIFRSYSWPGNVRELLAVVESAVYRAQFEGSVTVESVHVSFHSIDALSDENQDFHSQVTRFKQELVRNAMGRSGQNQSEAARLLGLDRSTLRRLLRGD